MGDIKESETRPAYTRAFRARQDAWEARNAAWARREEVDSAVRLSSTHRLRDGTLVTEEDLIAADRELALAKAALAAAEAAEEAALLAGLSPLEGCPTMPMAKMDEREEDMTQRTVVGTNLAARELSRCSLTLGSDVRFMDGDTPVLSGRVIGLLQAPTVDQTTVLLGGFKLETGETVERSRLVLPDWLDGGPDRWIEEMPF
jgi:hypothetical protein